MIPNEQRELFTALKSTLKKRGISYLELSMRLGVAESTLKRLFALEECSLGKLIEILNAIDLSLSDLVALTKNQEAKSYSLTEEKEKELANNLDVFFFFKKLTHFQTLDEMLKAHRLTFNDVKYYIKQLEKIELISREKNNKIKFKYKGFLKLKENGPLQLAIFEHWLPQLHQKIVKSLPNKTENTLQLFSLYSTYESKRNFLKEYNEAKARFLKAAEYDFKTNAKDTVPFTVYLAIGKYPVDKF